MFGGPLVQTLLPLKQIKNLKMPGSATPPWPGPASLRHARLELQNGNEERSRRKASFSVKGVEGGFGLWSFEDGAGSRPAHDAPKWPIMRRALSASEIGPQKGPKSGSNDALRSRLKFPGTSGINSQPRILLRFMLGESPPSPNLSESQ